MLSEQISSRWQGKTRARLLGLACVAAAIAASPAARATSTLVWTAPLSGTTATGNWSTLLDWNPAATATTWNASAPANATTGANPANLTIDTTGINVITSRRSMTPRSPAIR